VRKTVLAMYDLVKAILSADIAWLQLTFNAFA
jgi:hypothetical protein